ncbi:hypothetical protein VTI74DRAFT_669 [Chaetomium olivicolor]
MDWTGTLLLRESEAAGHCSSTGTRWSIGWTTARHGLGSSARGTPAFLHAAPRHPAASGWSMTATAECNNADCGPHTCRYPAFHMSAMPHFGPGLLTPMQLCVTVQGDGARLGRPVFLCQAHCQHTTSEMSADWESCKCDVTSSGIRLRRGS